MDDDEQLAYSVDDYRPGEPRCLCCQGIWQDGRRRYLGPAVVAWYGPNYVPDPRNLYGPHLLCQHCFDCWLDNADDDPDMEPKNVVWLKKEPIRG